jgi:MFS family permease
VLFALDQFIITVSVPQIVDEFQALSRIEWLNTAFFIPCAGGILIYSQIMTVFSPRWVYLFAVLGFEIGSALCGAAGSMNMLIAGRAMAGLGGAGMWK